MEGRRAFRERGGGCSGEELLAWVEVVVEVELLVLLVTVLEPMLSRW